MLLFQRGPPSDPLASGRIDLLGVVLFSMEQRQDQEAAGFAWVGLAIRRILPGLLGSEVL